MIRYTQTILALILATPLFLSGCGGGGNNGGGGLSYTGNTTETTISAVNIQRVAKTVTEGATQSINEFTANESNPFALAVVSSSLPSNEINTTVSQIIRKVQDQANNLVTAITIGASEFTGDPAYCGGSITVPDNFNGTSGSMSFNNFCYNVVGEMTMNGSINFSQTATSLSISYVNFTVTFEGQSFTINSSISCALDGSGCTISSNFTGSDGNVYRIDNFSVVGDSTSGFNVDATVFDPTYGSVTITTTSPILFGCSGPQPSSGAISFTGTAGTSGSIIFESCTSYTYTYDLGVGPVSNQGTW